MRTNQVRAIESPANAQFKIWKSCLEPQGMKKHGLALLSGKKLVEEFLQEQPEKAEALIGDTKIVAHSELPTYALAKVLFKELDLLGTDSPLLLIKAPKYPEWTAEKAQGKEIFLALQDPGNLGAALRLAEAFNASKVICLKECAHPLHPKSLKASAGSALRLPLFKGPSIQKLSDMDLEFIGLDKSGTLISEFKWPKNFRLVLGEEGRGLPEDLKIKALQIPINDHLESLNATAALAIALYCTR